MGDLVETSRELKFDGLEVNCLLRQFGFGRGEEDKVVDFVRGF